METKLEIFMGIMSFICFALFVSVVVARAVKWVQQWYTRKRNREEIDKMLRRQALRRAMDRMPNNDSATDMASDPKPWAANPVLSTRRDVAQDKIQEAPHTMWCPRCGSHKKHLAHAVGGVPHHKCEDCGQRYKQMVIANPTKQGPVRWDRNAIEAVPAAPSSLDLEGHWPGAVIFDEIAQYPPEDSDIPNKGGWNDTQDEPVTFGGGDFGGSGAGDSYDSSTDSGSSSTDTSSSSDYSSSNDD